MKKESLVRKLKEYSIGEGVPIKWDRFESLYELFLLERPTQKFVNMFLRTLCYHDDTDPLEAWAAQKVIQRFSNSRENLIAFYGEKEGEKRFNANALVSSRRNRGFSTLRRWYEQGLGEEEVAELHSKSIARRVLSRGHVDMRQKLKWCKEYYLLRGYSDEEAEELRRQFFFGCITNDPDKRKKQAQKGSETKRKMNSPPTTVGASKVATKFFEGLIEEFPTLKGSSFGLGRELCLKDVDVPNRFYFYDFTNRERNLIIEYDGSVYHPRSKDGVFNSYLKHRQVEFYERDCRKEELAAIYGYTFLRFRDDFTPEEIERFKRELRELL